MVKIRQITQIIEKTAPKELAEEWDNVGLLIGSEKALIDGVVVCVDLTNDCIDYAIKNNCNLIITHHPAIFSPLKSITDEDYTSKLAIKCVQNNINVYSAHTNMDIADGGINACSIFKIIGSNGERLLSDGLGFYGKTSMKFEDILQKVIDFTGDMQPKTYKRNSDEQNVAFIGGSGGGIEEIVKTIKEKKVNCIISSEFKHHIIMQLLNNNINIIQIGHYESEKIFVNIVFELLKDINCNIKKYYTELI